MSRTAVIIIVVVVILGLLLCCCLGAVGLFAARSSGDSGLFGWLGALNPTGREVTNTFEQQLRVDTPVTLVIANEVGRVTVRGGDVDAIVIRADVKARAGSATAANRLLEQVDFQASSSGNRAEIRVDLPSSMVNASTSVDLHVTVPQRTSVDLRSNVGEVQVSGIEGTMQVRTEVGEVTIWDVALSGPSEAQASVGEVNFQGTLPPAGEVRLSAQVGEVRVTLPRESEFRLDASTGIGDIDCDFALVDRVEDDNRGPASELRGRVGADPQVTLILRSGTGGMQVRQR